MTRRSCTSGRIGWYRIVFSLALLATTFRFPLKRCQEVEAEKCWDWRHSAASSAYRGRRKSEARQNRTERGAGSGDQASRCVMLQRPGIYDRLTGTSVTRLPVAEQGTTRVLWSQAGWW